MITCEERRNGRLAGEAEKMSARIGRRLCCLAGVFGLVWVSWFVFFAYRSP